MAKRAGRVGSIGLRVKQVTGHFKQVKNSSSQSGCGSGRVDLYFSHNYLFIYLFLNFYKENNMYLPFGKLCNKLLDVKCIIFNSSLILKMSLVKLINTYSIILKLYKS